MSMAQKPILDKRSILERLPVELFDTVTPHLDSVDLLCLKYTSRHFYASIPKPALSPCARIEIIYYLNLDRPRASKMYTPTLFIPTCPGYSKTRSWKDPTYCGTCRAEGHEEYCQECGVRTCVRRSNYRWKKWVKEEKERKERKAAEALLAAEKKKRSQGNAKGEKRRKTKASSALENYMTEDGPIVRLRSGESDMKRMDVEYRDEPLASDPSRKGWGTQGIVFDMPVIEELSIDADEEMVDEMEEKWIVKPGH
jgi:hypothetical protein